MIVGETINLTCYIEVDDNAIAGVIAGATLFMMYMTWAEEDLVFLSLRGFGNPPISTTH